MDNKQIGEKLREMRLEKGFTQGQLGALIGKSNESIKKYESGYTTVPIDVLQKIAEKVGYEMKIAFVKKAE